MEHSCLPSPSSSCLFSNSACLYLYCFCFMPPLGFHLPFSFTLRPFFPSIFLCSSSSVSLLFSNYASLLSCFFLPVQCPAHEVRFDSTGVILSPGYPDNYPNLQMCSWLINVEKGYNITLHFELFQTEKEFDILEIFDGGFSLNFSVCGLW